MPLRQRVLTVYFHAKQLCNSLIGEFEIFHSGGTPIWWLPGFIQAVPNPDDPTRYPNPGEGDPYPLDNYITFNPNGAAQQWMTFVWKVFPDRQEIYKDTGGGSLQLKARMPLPESSAELRGYRYHDVFKAARVYYRGSGTSKGLTELDYVRVVREPVWANQAPVFVSGPSVPASAIIGDPVGVGAECFEIVVLH